MSTLGNVHASYAPRSERRFGIDAVAAASKALAALAVTTLSLVALLPQTDVIAMQTMLV